MLIAVAAAASTCPTTAVDALLGRWHGRASDEHWVAVGTWLVGVSLEDGFVELLAAPREGGPAYLARPGGGPVTRFPCVSSGPGEVVFEDLAHDWPTTVAYTRRGPGLQARVDADGGPVLRRRWRASSFEVQPLPGAEAAADAALWWGDAALPPERLPALQWEVRATARRGPWTAALGSATLDGQTRPFSAVWRVVGDDAALTAFSGW